MEKYLYQAVITPAGDGRYEARIPELGVSTFGDGLADAAFMAQDAMALAISVMLKEGEAVPRVGAFRVDAPEGSLLVGIATLAEAGDVLDDTMTVQEAADILDVSRARIYALMDDGRIGSVKVGNMRMVDARDVMDEFNNPRSAGRPRKAALA